jgi:hypothetical protein
MTTIQASAIERHGMQLLAIFPDATERDPVKLCKKLRRLEAEAHAIAERLCNGPEFGTPEEVDARCDAILRRVRAMLCTNQPKTGAKCGCKRGQERDNCPSCEGTGQVIDFARIRRRKSVPIFINRDPRGYALKIDDAWMRETNAALHTDWGGYGIIAPEFNARGQ